MDVFNSHLQSLMHRLEEKGMDKGLIPGFIWSMKSCMPNYPDIDCVQLNRKIQTLGWHDFHVDYSTLRLISVCFQHGFFSN